jgi:hypothetical protein
VPGPLRDNSGHSHLEIQISRSFRGTARFSTVAAPLLPGVPQILGLLRKFHLQAEHADGALLRFPHAR